MDGPRQAARAGSVAAMARLWDDNPSSIDLLGFDAVVAPVRAAIAMPDLDPLTIGIHGPWGGGKSTVLGLIALDLANDDAYVVVRVNPWEFDDQADVKGTLIAQVLQTLEERFRETAGVTTKVQGLLKRISWARVTLALAKGALTMQWDVDALVQAFTPKAREQPESMAGFRDAFKELIDSIPRVTRVVVLVDDLDRCLPHAVMGTLEAIKLFLSVEKMVFVIAADKEMVRDAIAANLAQAPRGERFAKRYLDKIIQLPISLPRVALYEAEAYIGLLLARGELEADRFAELVEHCRRRRAERHIPLLWGFPEGASRPTESDLSLAGQLTRGLRADRVTNPREIKRFLNEFGVRGTIAEQRGLSVRPAVIAKLLLLEDRFPKDFETLATTPEADRRELLSRWERFARNEEGARRPEGTSEESMVWAATDPTLTDEDVGPYITLAASLTAVEPAAGLSDELADLVSQAVGPSQAARGLAIAEITTRQEAEQMRVLEVLFARTSQAEDTTFIVQAVAAMAKATASLADEVATGIEQVRGRLEPASVVDLAASGVPALVAVVRRLTDDATVEHDVREAARQALPEKA
jgi:hypothetical protein